MTDTGRTEADRQEALYSTDWLTPEEAGQIAGGVSSTTILAAIDAGEIKWMDARSPGSSRRRVKIRRDWLEAWMGKRVSDAA